MKRTIVEMEVKNSTKSTTAIWATYSSEEKAVEAMEKQLRHWVEDAKEGSTFPLGHNFISLDNREFDLNIVIRIKS